MMKEAVEAYKVRVLLGGWKEEAFEAQMRVVSIAEHQLLVCLMMSVPKAIGMGNRSFNTLNLDRDLLHSHILIGNPLWGAPSSRPCILCVFPQQLNWGAVLIVLRRGVAACAGAHPAQRAGGGRGVGAAGGAPHVALARRAAGLPGLAIRPPHAGAPLNTLLQCIRQCPGTPYPPIHLTHCNLPQPSCA